MTAEAEGGVLGSRRLLPALLMLTIVSYAVALSLPWHHRWDPALGAYRIVDGIDGASWLLGVIVLCAVLAWLLSRDQAGFYTKMAAAITAFLALTGMVVDYLNWQAVGAEANSPVFVGPGFYVALAGSGVLVLTTVLAGAGSNPGSRSGRAPSGPPSHDGGRWVRRHGEVGSRRVRADGRWCSPSWGRLLLPPRTGAIAY